ncbi:MAG: hypothetical protein HQM16_03045 [Deltaproteobacteria bacterium]|nr:hypothetical protein [Deltaproteobacteria bacterium]
MNTDRSEGVINEFKRYLQSENLEMNRGVFDAASGATYKVLSREHAEQASWVIGTSFANCDPGEPMTKYDKVTIEEFAAFAYPSAVLAADEGHSVVATDRRGRIIGASIARDITAAEPDFDSYNVNLEKFYVPLDLLEKIHRMSLEEPVATGYKKDHFPEMPWITDVVGKRPPFFK